MAGRRYGGGAMGSAAAWLGWAGGSLRRTAPGQSPLATIEFGPAALGAIVRFNPAEGVMRVGERAAPYACALLAFADREYGTGFGHCWPAPDRR